MMSVVWWEGGQRLCRSDRVGCPCSDREHGWGPAEPGVRVLRGGSWNNNNEDNLRCANRNNNHPTNRNNNNGFRGASTGHARARPSTDDRGVRTHVQAGSR